MIRRFVLMLALFYFVPIKAQKVVVLLNLNKSATAYRTNGFFRVGDSAYYYLSSTKSSYSSNIPIPSIAYEFKSQNRLSITPNFFREEVYFMDSTEYNSYMVYSQSIHYKGATGAAYSLFSSSGSAYYKIITKFRRLDFNYEYNIGKQRKHSLFVCLGLSYSWQAAKFKSSYGGVIDPVKANERSELLEKYKKSGNFISGNAAIAYKYKRFQMFFGGGSSFLRINNKDKTIKRQVYLTGGLKYDLFKKTQFKDQLKNNYNLNTDLNIKKAFDIGIHIRYDLITRSSHKGEQGYFYNGTSSSKYESYAYFFSTKPTFKTSPDFVVQAKWTLKNLPIAIRTSIGEQTFRVHYPTTVYILKDNNLISEDEDDFFMRSTFLVGMEKQKPIKNQLNLFYAIDIGINHFFTANFGGAIENVSERTEDDSDLAKFTPIADAQVGCSYKRASLYLMYSVIPTKYSNSGAYVLKNLQQVKIGLSYTFIERRRNEKN